MIEHPEENWDYVELTEVVIEKNETAYSIKFVLWSSGNILISCNSAELIEK